MYQGTHAVSSAEHSRGRSSRKGLNTLILSLLLLLALAVFGTVAFLAGRTGNIRNVFTPAHVGCEVTEHFDGTVKSEVNVKNTGDTEAYIRVKLVTYRVNEDGQRIGGAAVLPAFTPGDGWVSYEGCYYYTEPVPPGGSPAEDLIAGIELVGRYEDADGGKQAIDVMAEAIQCAPAEAVNSSWGVVISSGAVSAWQ